MPRISGSVENGCENSNAGNSEVSKKFLPGKDYNSLEFRAEIINYDDLKDPNAPILAVSGDNINLIFNIPKESFRKLAVAAIGRLDSDSEPSEKSTSTGYSQSNSHTEKSESSVKSSLNSIVQNLEGDNTNHIIAAYEEDCNEPRKPESPNVSPVGVKSNEDSVLIMNKSESPMEESTSSMGESTKLNKDNKSPVSGQLLSGCTSASLNAERISNSSNEEFSNLDYAQCSSVNEKEISEGGNSIENGIQFKKNLVHDSKRDFTGDEIDGDIKLLGIENPEQQDTFDEEQSNDTNQNASEELELSAHSLGFSYEDDCPELETAWPVIQPFTETENIPVKELKSIELNGVLTKYLKLEFSSEFVVLRISSESDVLVDAAKYKEADSMSESNIKEINTDKDSQSKEKSSESFTCQMCKKMSVVDKLNESTQNSSNQDNQSLDVTSLLSISSSEVIEFPVSELSSNLKEIACEPCKYGTPIKDFRSTDLQKAITLKLEEKLKEPDDNIPGSSPTERLKFILNEGLKNSCDEADLNKQTEEFLCNTSGVLDSSEAKSHLAKKSDSNDSQILKKEREDNSQSECLHSQSGSECASACVSEKPDEHSPANKDFESFIKENEDCAIAMSIHSENKFNAEIALCDTNDCLKPENIQNEESRNHSFGNSLENSGLNNSFDCSENEVSMNTSVQIENKVNEDIDSQSKLESDLCEFKKTEISENKKASDELYVSGSPENTRSLKNEIVTEDCETTANGKISKPLEDSLEGIDSPSKLESSSGDFQKEVISERNENNVPDNENGTTEISRSQTKETIVEGIKITSNDKQLESLEDKFEEIVTEEVSCKDILATDAGSKSVEETLKEKLNTDEIILGKNLDNFSEEMKTLESSEVKSEKLNQTELSSKISEDFQSKEKNIEIKHELNSSKLESHLCDGMKNLGIEKISEETVTDVWEIVSDTVESELSNEANFSDNESNVERSFDPIDFVRLCMSNSEVKQPESSFASNLDSSMDTTVDAAAESMSEAGDLESDDVKSVASESDDIKDNEKRACVATHRNLKKKQSEADEVDCAPTRVRRKKVVATLTKDVIPENAEVKNVTSSKVRSSTLDVPSKHPGKTSPVGRYLRSKSLDPTPQPSKGADKKHSSVLQSEESNRRSRAKTPDVISRKDIKTPARSSPRKLERSSATTESNTSKVQSTKTSANDKSQANLDSSTSTSKRGKRGNKD